MQDEDYFIEAEEMIGQENNEIEMQERIFNDLKSGKDVHKQVSMDWMEQKIDE
jgi:hypothetical protein